MQIYHPAIFIVWSYNHVDEFPLITLLPKAEGKEKKQEKYYSHNKMSLAIIKSQSGLELGNCSPHVSEDF